MQDLQRTKNRRRFIQKQTCQDKNQKPVTGNGQGGAGAAGRQEVEDRPKVKLNTNNVQKTEDKQGVGPDSCVILTYYFM